MCPKMFVWVLFSMTLIFVRVRGLNQGLREQSVLYGISSVAHEFDNSSICYQQLDLLCNSIDSHHVWAMKALDASGQPGSGFFYGNNLWLGSHSQCSDLSNTKPFEINYDKVKHPLATPYDYPPVPMRFVMVYMKHNSTLQHHTQMPLDFTIQLGLCLPKICANADIADLVDSYLSKRYLTAQNLYELDLELIELRALDDDEDDLLRQPTTIILLFIVCTVSALAIVGTIYDVRKHNRAKNLVTGHNNNIRSKQTTPNSVSSDLELVSKLVVMDHQTSVLGEFVKCFSIYSNVNNLVKTKLSSDSVAVIHGLRFFGMLWVIMVHAVFYQVDYLENVPFGYRLSEDLFAQILSNSTYCVDTYLFLSGFLLAYLFFKLESKKAGNEKINYVRKLSDFIMMCVNRFLRLTPPYMIVILFTSVMYSHYRKSSALHSSEFPHIQCSKYWWRNLLYINNLYPRSEMCLSWSWYLSIDTQFFTISAFLLILSTIMFKVTAVLVGLLILANIIATTVKSYSIGYIPTMDEQFIQLDAIYDLPWNRIGPYLVGVITAYVLLVKLKKTLILRERTRIFLWIVFPMLNLWILFTLYTRQLSIEFSAIYMGLSRTLWGVGMGWLLIACCTGNARALEKFLAFRGWIPLSRLTYCAYLLNPLVANMVYLGSETSLHASLATFSVYILGITMITFYISFLFSMLFESPFILLTKMAFKHLTGKKQSDGKAEETA